jgi:hypothetical protein
MRRPRPLGTVLRSTLALLVVASGLLAGAIPAAQADSRSTPPFDFSDAFYRQNGVDPALLAGRPTGDGVNSVVEPAPDANHRNVRVRRMLPAYDTSGGIHFFNVFGDLQPNAFLANAAGAAERNLAERSIVYVFPTRGSDPTTVRSNRQADMIDLSNGYFSNNRLGIWVHVFVNWTPAAFDTATGRATLSKLAARNGTALDGTPVIRQRSQIDDLASKGLVTLVKRATTETGRWFICPVLKDPRDGAIAKDATLAFVRDASGSPLPAAREFVRQFESLRLTGDWAS